MWRALKKPQTYSLIVPITVLACVFLLIARAQPLPWNAPRQDTGVALPNPVIETPAPTPVVATPAEACTAAMLHGTYSYLLAGVARSERAAPAQSMPGRVDVAVVGEFATLALDGEHGSLSGIDTSNWNGQVSRSRTVGAYEVVADCTGSLTLSVGDIPLQLRFVLVDGGSELYLMSADPAGSLTGSGKRIASSALGVEAPTAPPAQPVAEDDEAESAP